MIPAFRRIIVVGRALSQREQGPLVYSGAEMRHPEAARATEPTTRYAIAFWYWVPEGHRHPWSGKSAVPDITAQEAAMLAWGTIEEVRRNFAFPQAMHLRTVGEHLLRNVWEPECVRRLGQLPDVFRGSNPLALAPAAQQLEQDRNRIEVVSG